MCSSKCGGGCSGDWCTQCSSAVQRGLYGAPGVTYCCADLRLPVCLPACLPQVLDEIGVQDLPMITAWNKIDACPNPAAVRALAASRPDVVAVSGATGEGLDELLEMVAVKLAENMVDMQVGPDSQGVIACGLCHRF